MPIKKKLTLGLSLLVLASSALADTYKIKSGDTIERIAKKYSVSQKALLSANGLKATSVLKIGQSLTIPGTTSKKDVAVTKSVPASKGGYVVRNGDHDWTIAKKHGITPTQLHKLNPGINWKKLQIGQKLNVPGSTSTVAQKTSAAKPVAKVSAGGTYTVKSGDNDWIIARRAGTTPKVIRDLNPKINWSKLQIGQKVAVPGAKLASAGTTTPKITSRTAVITGDAVTIRRGPSRSNGAITKVNSGTKVTVLDRKDDWYKLRFPRGTEGWVLGTYIKAVTPTVAQSTKPAAQKTQPVAKKQSIDDEVGHITQEIVALQQKGGTVDKVLTSARSMRGVRYKWGAASRSATDCSGFTTQAFKSAGITLPRTSGAQAKVGSPVAKKDLKAGDLVFFRTTRGSRISHVGIYTGNGKFIHASSGGGKVMESSLNEGYYKARYVTARRLVKSSKQANASFPATIPPIENTKPVETVPTEEEQPNL